MKGQPAADLCLLLAPNHNTGTSGIICPVASGYSVTHSGLTVVIPQTAAHQASLSFIISQSLPKFMSIELMMPFNHLILCCPLHFLPSIFPSIRVFSNESTLCIKWPKYWSFSFSTSPSNEYSRLISFRIGWFHLWWAVYSLYLRSANYIP